MPWPTGVVPWPVEPVVDCHVLDGDVVDVDINGDVVDGAIVDVDTVDGDVVDGSVEFDVVVVDDVVDDEVVVVSGSQACQTWKKHPLPSTLSLQKQMQQVSEQVDAGVWCRRRQVFQVPADRGSTCGFLYA